MNNLVKIESIPTQTILDSLAALDPTKGYIKGRYIDIYDKASWRVATITNVTSDSVSVQYEGRENEQAQIKITSGRVAPFRRFTRGSTGQGEATVRPFKYIRIKKDALERKLEKLMKDSFVVRDPEEFVQFFRGEFFFYVDSLLTRLDTANLEPESVKEIMIFLNLCMKAIVEWMRDSWDLKGEFEAAENWDLLYKIHGRTSLCTAYPELAEMLSNFLGGSQKTLNTFRFLYGNNKSTLGNNEEGKMALGWCVTYFYREFKTAGGLEEIVRMIRAYFLI